MTRAILRSFAIGALTLLLGLGGDVVYVLALCPPHHVWERVRDGRTSVVLDSGYRYAVLNETIDVCTVPHAAGPIVFHQDLTCYCAPPGVDAAALGRSLGGTCVVDQPHPSRGDESGACRHAHCVEPIAPGLLTP